ncbi:hypothetical protein Q058_03425 [Pseudomonas aeruginosa BL04]|nr:hypothetical protein Q058_03425 [Pseudomonas aeruginosa BL04]
MKDIILASVLTCPHCGFAKQESMPTEACLFYYECSSCGTLLRPTPGDCCVFCSFGSVKCPPIQAGSCCASDVLQVATAQNQPEADRRQSCGPNAHDTASKRSTLILLWFIPAIVASAALLAADAYMGLLLVAALAFAVMGAACAVNAARCGRLHCFVTGPYFLLLALAAVGIYLYPGWGGGSAQIWLLATFALLSPLLVWLPERLARRTYFCTGDASGRQA